MEITITINGKPVKATVDDAAVKEAMGEKQEKKTGYERAAVDGMFYYQTYSGCVGRIIHAYDCYGDHDNRLYEAGIYYTNKDVAINNDRADELMRNLRRFAAEHGGCVPPGKTTKSSVGRSIYWDGKKLEVCSGCGMPDFGRMWFASDKAAHSAIVAFHDELMWYFTEYDPMPEGWRDE